MEGTALKLEIVENIKTDPILFGLVASTLGISPFSLPRLLAKNDEKLTQVSVLNAIKKHLGRHEDNDLLEYSQEKSSKITTRGIAAIIVGALLITSCNVKFHPGNNYKYHSFYKHQNSDTLVRR